ncbi:hypothetical protein [Luteolibacter luteus]|uniref:Uncharacterized protein n=1 Tax=Luteolibacter luteus TaxID=2728835 RepID=A0A858RLF4_9BACT|nr:hypothetical protein [Luteolibacter luteus]QJE97324.1 hypothetical protein HHL09_16520 [Luteolibacter luteus]
MLVIGCIIFCCRLDGAESEEFSQLRVIDAARELDQLEEHATEKLSFDSPGVKEVEGLIREDIRSNRGRGTVVILSEWDPGSMAWEVAAQTILYRMSNWEAVPMEEGEVVGEVDLAVMVDLFKATIRKNDKSGDYTQRRGRIGSPYTFRNFYSSHLAQAVEPRHGYSPDAKRVHDDPKQWLEDEILSRTGPLPSVLDERGVKSGAAVKTRAPKGLPVPKGDGPEDLKGEKPAGGSFVVIVAVLSGALVVGVFYFRKAFSR